ncbi:MAG: Cof-type HAD-IIB family hydrolase [Eubacteriales bacterium]|nr:Cof-type HAD-IIB family hydrolase [Eubacteriales bacterium]
MTVNLFAGLLLVCDIDGTLLDSQNQLSQENILAIRHFIELGGKFTVASGRTLAAMNAIRSAIPINMPVISVNGAIISRLYEKDQSAIWESRLDDQTAAGLILRLAREFPTLGIEIFTDRTVYPFRINDTVRWHATKEVILENEYALEDIPRPWCKICLADENTVLLRVNQYLLAILDDSWHLAFSEETFLDILDRKASKGEAVRVLQKMFGITKSQTAVIGDNFNDIPMVGESGYSFAVGNACVELKRLVQHVVASNNHNGVAEAIRVLEQQLVQNKITT